MTSIKWEDCEDALAPLWFPWPEHILTGGTLTWLERRNQSYLRRLSDQDNNHDIESEKRERERKRKKTPTSHRSEMMKLLHRVHCCG